MRRFRWLLSLALLLVLIPGAAAQHVMTFGPTAVLGVCADGHLNDDRLVCTEVANRPAQFGECAIDLSFDLNRRKLTAYHGQFAGDGADYILIPYEGCEPRAGGLRGALLYTSPGALDPQIPRWLPGAQLADCVPMERPNPPANLPRDVLICASGGGNQGMFFGQVSLVHLDTSGEYPAMIQEDPPLVTADSNGGAHGAEVISCQGSLTTGPRFISLGALRGIDRQTVEIETTFIPATRIAQACGDNWAPVETFMPKADGDAFVNPLYIARGTLRIQPWTGEVTLVQ